MKKAYFKGKNKGCINFDTAFTIYLKLHTVSLIQHYEIYPESIFTFQLFKNYRTYLAVFLKSGFTTPDYYIKPFKRTTSSAVFFQIQKLFQKPFRSKVSE